jgi:threonine/homoserine/homoserine lactone efflux protein
MASAWTGIALLGLDAVFALFPWSYVTAKVSGAAYLLWLAVKMWRAARDPLNDVPSAPNAHAFQTGVAANLANPKSMLFAASVLVVIFPPDMGLADKALVVANQFFVETLAYVAFAAALSTPPARSGYLRLKPVFDRAAALVLGALGLRLIFAE